MTVKDFGITKDGIATKLYTLKNNNLEISVTDFGSTLVSIVVPDRNNKPTDIVLGYDDVSGYETDDGYYFGCNVGRCANRIARGHFVLNNTEYNLDINNGPNNLHSGLNPYSKRVWTVENQNDTSITFSLESPHMDQGFPGALKMYVTYELLEDGFKINYNATPDKDTIINVTNHSYFNLNGEGSGTVLNHFGKDFVAFGNDQNDISLFKNAIYGVQIGDYPYLKNFADEVIPACPDVSLRGGAAGQGTPLPLQRPSPKYKKSPCARRGISCLILQRAEQSDEQRQQDEYSGDPLRQAGELRVQRAGLALAKIGVGTAGDRAEAILCAILENDHDRQYNAGDHLEDQENQLQGIHSKKPPKTAAVTAAACRNQPKGRIYIQCLQ